MTLYDASHDWASETATVRELHELLASGRLREMKGDPFPVDPLSRHAGFPPRREDCTRVEPLSVRPVRRAIEQPATPFGPARSESISVDPPLAVVISRAIEYAYSQVAFEWAVSFVVEVGGSPSGVFYGNHWGWELDPSRSS